VTGILQVDIMYNASDLGWPLEDYNNISSIDFENDKLTTPGVTGCYTIEYDELPGSSTCEISNTGFVRNTLIASMSTTCVMNMWNVPFDSHNCQFCLRIRGKKGFPPTSVHFYKFEK
ncbi:hypothetical protein PMAYCL1PPCAC_10411, partial [Pristionchus mayeri]